MNVISEHVNFEDFFDAFSELNNLHMSRRLFSNIYLNAENASEVFKIYRCIDKHFSNLKYDKISFTLFNDKGEHVYSNYIDLLLDYDFITLINFNNRLAEYSILKSMVIAVSLYFGLKSLDEDNMHISKRTETLVFIFNLKFQKIKEKVRDMRIIKVIYDEHGEPCRFLQLNFFFPGHMSYVELSDDHDGIL